MNEKATDILAHISLPGLVAALVIGDREKSKFYLNQCITLNLAALALYLIGLIPLPFIGLVSGIGGFLLSAAWSYSFIGAILGSLHSIPLLERVKIIKYEGEKTMYKIGEKATAIILHLTFGGLILGFWLGDRETETFKRYFRRCLLFNVAAVLLAAANYIPLAFMSNILLICGLTLGFCWVGSFLSVAIGKKNTTQKQ